MDVIGSRCDVCQSNTTPELFYRTPALPASGILQDKGDAPLPKRPLTFLFCPDCGFISQRGRTETMPDYSIVTRATKNQLPSYVFSILEQAKGYCDKEIVRIADVGCNDGSFLDLAAEHGFTLRLGVEPSRMLADFCSQSGHATVCTLFCTESVQSILEDHERADILFARHVLEHVPDPVDFLNGLRMMLAPGGFLFLECPDARGILFDLLGHELWDEHLGYYTETTLRLLMARCGFRVVDFRTEPHRGGRNLLCWAVADPDCEAGFDVHAVTIQEELVACREFAPAWEGFCRKMRVEAVKWVRPVAALGASHPQSNFLWYTGLAEAIDVLVDDDPMKVGKHLFLGRQIPIATTCDVLEELKPKTLLSTAFGCDSWTSKVLAEYGKQGVSLNPYSLW